MAGRSYSSDSSKFTPFEAGLIDYKYGIPTNCYMQTTRDATVGQQTYFRMRPSINFVNYFTNPLDLTHPGIFRAMNTRCLASTMNAYILDYGSPLTRRYAFTSTVATSYQTSLSDGYGVRVIFFNKTAGDRHRFYCIGSYTQSCFYAMDDTEASGSGTKITLTFNPNPYGVEMDGYLFYAQYQTDTIYNCALNDITSWNTSINLIAASQYPGNIIALGKLKNYVVAYKENSVEFFYNAGLTSTSPLQRNLAYTKKVGLSYANSLVEVRDTAFFVGKDEWGARKVYKLTDSDVTLISTPYIDSILESGGENPYTASITGYFLAYENKNYYVLNSTAAIGDGFGPYCLVYDIEANAWMQWSLSTCDYFPIQYSAGDFFDGYTGTFLFGNNLNPTDNTVGLPYYSLKRLSKDYVYDNRKLFGHTLQYHRIETTFPLPPTDFGTGNRKFIRELSISGNYPAGLEYTVTVKKYNGGENKILSQVGTNRNNLNFKNFGQAIAFAVDTTIRDLDDTTEGSVSQIDMSNAYSYGINYSVSEGPT